jgi:hypothetical protein
MSWLVLTMPDVIFIAMAVVVSALAVLELLFM